MGGAQAVRPQHSSTNTHTTTRPRGPGLAIWRGVWVIITLMSVALVVAGASARYADLLGLVNPYSADLMEIGIPPRVYVGILFALSILQLVVGYATGLLIFWRRSDDWIAILVSLMLIEIASSVSEFPRALLPHYPWLLLPVHLIVSLNFGLPTIILFMFPTSQYVPRWSRWLVLFQIVWTGVRTVLAGTPLHPDNWPALLGFLWALAWFGGGIAAQVYRYRRVSTPNQRQQTKWVVVGGAITAFAYILILLVPVIVPAVKQPGLVSVIWRLIDNVSFLVALLTLPVSFTLSMLRYRLWDVDFVINRSLVYGALTVLLLAVFGASVFAVQAIIELITGREQLPVIALMVGALVIGTLFQPARIRLRRFVDRRFYGIELDYNKAADDYARREKAPVSRTAPRTAIGAFKDLELLGRGGMSEVYLSYQPDLKRHVAIKILPPAQASDADLRKRFIREAQATSHLKHPNIIGIYEIGEEDGLPYMIMDYVTGEDLSEMLARRGRFPLDELRPILFDVASALDYVHQNGIVHRDIKPSNIMIEMTTSPRGEERPHAVLMDFGIARLLDSTTRLTQTGLVGTLDYIAPEQIQGASEVDGRADVYSLGVMTYQLLAGELPFKHGNPGALVLAHLMQPPPDPRHKVPDLPEGAAIAVMRAMSKKPDERYPGAGEFVAALG